MQELRMKQAIIVTRSEEEEIKTESGVIQVKPIAKFLLENEGRINSLASIAQSRCSYSA
jgi:hypothetical protein